jgi:outer membrane protein OmpA-like peptidoglycan-associated protein
MKRFSSLILCVALSVGALAQDPLRQRLFTEADAALAAATGADARLLAPRAFERGAVAYTSAESDLERGRSVERITAGLAEATGHFNEAAEIATFASVTLASVIAARGDAVAANATTFSAERWGDAEDLFANAARRLEAGTLESARELAVEAETAYRDAELTAIKAQHLSRAQAMLFQAEQDRVPRYAPRRFAEAQSLLAQAEQALDNDRYNLERPRELAQQAEYTTRHAIYLASRVAAIDRGETTFEDVILGYESALGDAAAAAEVEAAFDAGPEPVASSLVARIEASQAREAQLLAETEINRVQIVGLQDEIRDLDERLGGVSEERQALIQRVEADAAVRAQFARVESMFDGRDALVYREGDNIVLRLVGLRFEVGESTIATDFAPLIAKVRDAANVFPRSLIIVEGHTDSRGSDTANLALSRSRAEAVGRFLTGELGVAGFRVRAMGFGETRPIANNETEQGRARNRRIDVRIEPPRG